MRSRVDRVIVAILNWLNPCDAVYRADKPAIHVWFEGKLIEWYFKRRRNEDTLAVEQAQQAFIASPAPDDAQAPADP